MRLLILTIVACLAAVACSEKIVGGFSTTIESYPWQVSLRYAGNHTCGGSIINANTIVTAAHCLYGYSSSLLTVAYGTTNSSEVPSSNVIRVSSSSIHPQYIANIYFNDIGIIKLASSIPFSTQAQPIALYESTVSLVGKNVEASGWGSTVTNGSVSNVLNAVEMQVVAKANSALADIYGMYYDDAKQLIAGTSTGGKDACSGDSGGPLVLRSNPVRLVGITSYTDEDCGKGGVYTRVSNYAAWIKARA